MLKHTQKIKNIFEDIQRCLYYMIPEKWEKLFLYTSVVDLDDGNQGGELYFYYIPKGIIKKKPVNVYEIPNKFNLNEKEYTGLVRRLYEYIKVLKDEYKKSTIGDVWTNFTMSIINNKFKVEFFYDDLNDSDYDSYQRHIIWRYKYLGITEDQIGSKKDREILNGYLNGPQQILKTDVYESGIYITDIKNIIGYNTESYDDYDSYTNESENNEKESKVEFGEKSEKMNISKELEDLDYSNYSKKLNDSNNNNINNVMNIKNIDNKDRRKNINNYTNESHKVENDWDHRKKKKGFKSKFLKSKNESDEFDDLDDSDDYNSFDRKNVMRNQILFSDVELNKLKNKED